MALENITGCFTDCELRKLNEKFPELPFELGTVLDSIFAKIIGVGPLVTLEFKPATNELVTVDPLGNEMLVADLTPFLDNVRLDSASLNTANGIVTFLMSNGDQVPLDLSALDQSAQVATNTANIAGNTTNIANNATAIATLITDLTNVTTQVTTNTSNITTNTSNIAANLASINTNTTNITTNAGNIATNTTNIAGNTTNITTNAGNIATNTTGIAANVADIAALALRVTANELCCTTNTADIAALQTLTATHTTQIATHTATLASLHTVAFTGDYNDLLNLPSAPDEHVTAVSQVGNDLVFNRAIGGDLSVTLDLCGEIITTRAALLSLKTAGNLDPCKTYSFPVTQVGGSGFIYLKPLSNDKLPSNVHFYDSVLTGSTLWPAYYDIDADEFQMLHDPVLNNTVYEEGSINLFPWGVTAVINNSVRDANINYIAGTFANNEVDGNATVNINGGIVRRNYFGAESLTTIDSGDFHENRVESDANVAISTTGDVDNNHFKAGSNTIVSGASNVDTCMVMTDANLTVTGGTVVSCELNAESNTTVSGGSLSDSIVGEDSNVTIIGASNYENRFGMSVTYTQVGTGYLRYSSLQGNTTWTNGNTNVYNIDADTTSVNTTGSTGSIVNSKMSRFVGSSMQDVTSLTISDCEMTSFSSFSVNGASRVYAYRSSYCSGSRVITTGSVRVDTSYCKLDSYGYVQVTAGDLRCTGTGVSSYGYIQHTSTGANTVSRSSVADQSNIRFRDTADLNRVNYTKASSGARIDLNGTTSSSYLYYSEATSFARITLSNTKDARAYYCESSANGHILVQGNSGLHYMYYCSANSNGNVQLIDNTAAVRVYGCHADSQAILRIQNSTAAGRVYYSSFHAYYYAYITLTNTATRSALHGYGRRSYVVTNPPSGTFTQNF